MERYSYGDTYYPEYVEPSISVTTVAFGIVRVTDGYRYDFDDSTFKASGWTTPYQTMTENENPDGDTLESVWIYTTGWAFPDTSAAYKIVYKVTDVDGSYYVDGPKIEIVSGTYTDLVAAEGNFITQQGVKTEAQISGAGFDTLIDTLVAAVESLWDELTSRTWYETEQTEYYDNDSYGGTIFLKNFPVKSSADVTVYDDPDWSWAASALVSSDDYRVDYDRGVIHYNGYFYEGKQSLKVIYTAGYTSSTVPAWLKQILTRQAAHWLEQAKGKNWDVSSEAQPGGGTISRSQLQDNLLPDFVLAAERNER